MGASKAGRASSATGYLLTEKMVGLAFTSGCRGMEVMTRGLL